jgi:hypothetical protein
MHCQEGPSWGLNFTSPVNDPAHAEREREFGREQDRIDRKIGICKGNGC